MAQSFMSEKAINGNMIHGFEAIMQSKSVGVVFWSLEGRIIYANDQFLNIIGYSRDDLERGIHTENFNLPEFADRDAEARKQLKLTGSCLPYEKTIIRKDGTKAHILIGGSLFKDSEKEGISFVIDMTESRKDKEKLLDEERKFEALVKYNPIGIIESDFHGNILYANDAFLDMVGYSREELESGELKWTTLTPKEYLHLDEKAIEVLKKNKSCPPYEKQYIRKDGSKIVVQLGVTLFESDNSRCICFVRDITQRKMNREALEESEARFRYLADTAPVLIWMADTMQSYFYFNKIWLDFTGRKLEEEIGNAWMENIHPDDLDDYISKSKNAFDRREQFSIEYRLKRFDGVYRWMLDTGTPRYNSDDAFVGYIGSSVDITDRKEIEHRLGDIRNQLEDKVVERTHELALANEILKNEIKKREEIQNESQKAKDQLQAVVDAVPGAVSWFNSDLMYLGVNQYLADTLGLKTSDFMGKEIGFLESKSSPFSDFVRTFFQSNEINSSAEIVIGTNGKAKDYLVVAQKYNEGKAGVFVGIDITTQKTIQNELKKAKLSLEAKVQERTSELIGANTQLQKEITEREKAEKFLRQREERFRALVENSHDGIALVDEQGKLLYSGESAMKRILGYTNEELFVYDLFQLIHQKDRKRIAQILRKLLESPKKVIRTQFRLRHKNGAWRFVEAVLKNLIHESSIGAIVMNYRDVTDRKQAEKKVKKLAFYDKLTGVANRVLFLDKLEECLLESTQTHKRCAVMFIDLDRFKNVNDSLGHDAGDKVLKDVTKRIKKCIDKKMHLLGRLGGDEFAVILSGLEDDTDDLIIDTAQSIIEALSKPIFIKNNEAIISPSIGIAVYPTHSSEQDKLIRYADMAMYSAKKQQGNTFRFFDEKMSAIYLERVQIEKEIRHAIARNELELTFQPKVSLTTGKIVGVEALARWNSAKLGVISPLKFIPIAEETGLMGTMGIWIMEQACLELKKWQEKGYTDLMMAINVSDTQLINGFADKVKAIIEKTHLDPGCIEIELTESDIMHDDDLKLRVLNELQDLGVYISIDDFGTGYSSLRRLSLLPIDSLKIDQSFIRKMETNLNNFAIVKTTIDLAKNLNLKVIAEGVETKEQALHLKELNCDTIQGYFISEPLSGEKVMELFGREFEV